MSALQQHTTWTAFLSGVSGPRERGDCVVLDETGERWILATAANRTATGRRSGGICLSAGSQSVELQSVGVVPAAVSGLGAGSATTIRVSDAGRLERGSGGDEVGRCDADGTAYVLFGGSASGGGGGLPSASGHAKKPLAATQAEDGVEFTDTVAVKEIDHPTSFAVSVDGDGVAQYGDASMMTGVPRLGVPGSGTYDGVSFPAATPFSSDGYLSFSIFNSGGTHYTISNTQAAVTCLRFDNAGSSTARSVYFPVPASGNAAYAKDIVNDSDHTVTVAVNDAQPSALLTRTLAPGERGRFWFTAAGVRGPIAPAGGSTPTGTGLRKVVSGTEDAAASLLVNADVNASAAIAVSKLAAGSANTVLCGGSPNSFRTIVNADVNASAAIAGTKVAPDFGSQNVVTTGYVGLGASNLATEGKLRFPNLDQVIASARNFANTADMTLLAVDIDNNALHVGTDEVSTSSKMFSRTHVRATTTTFLGTVSGTNFSLDTAITRVGRPRVGDSTSYASEGRAAQAMADADQTPAASVYSRAIVQLTGACTAPRTVTFPHPGSEDASYVKTIHNATSGGHAMTVSTGTGTTGSVANGTATMFAFTPSGVIALS
jgi:hypothetical protein